MKDRILEFLKRENKTSAQFAEEIGVQPSGISHIVSGRNKPSLDFVLKMLEKYTFISTDWLLFGKGSMYKEPKMGDLFADIGLAEPETAREKVFVPEEGKDSDTGRNSVITQVDVKKNDSDHSQVTKIVWFFRNSTFKEYYPEKD